MGALNILNLRFRESVGLVGAGADVEAAGAGGGVFPEAVLELKIGVGGNGPLGGGYGESKGGVGDAGIGAKGVDIPSFTLPFEFVFLCP